MYSKKREHTSRKTGEITMVNVAVCDDNGQSLNILKDKVSVIMSEHNYKYRMTDFSDGIELVRYCKKNTVNIILADVDMPNMNGFEAIEELQKLQPDLNVIFVTAHSEFAYQAYDYHPFCFVCKSDLDRLNRVLFKLVDKINFKKERKEILHMQFEREVDINIDDVMYFDASKNYVIAHDRNGGSFSFRATVKAVYEKLRNESFILIQRGYIVNCRFIKILNRRYVILKNDEKKTMTRDEKRFREAEKIYKEYMRKEL